MVKTGEKTNRIQECRIRRTKLFNENRQEFFHQLINDIYAGIAYAEKRKMTPCFRLNATSDIEWEKLEAMPGINIFDLFPNVIFYDYTKIPNRKSPANYHLTFSRSEDNMIFVFDAILAKQNVAVVFHTVPEVWNNRKVVNGDETDLRFLDPRGVFVGLKAKGKAKTDKTGFVI